MGRRIAFILASIHEGTSVHMWNRSLGSIDLESDALYYIPGGRLDFKGNGEYLRNSIYSLVCPSNFDAIVSWTSSLTGEADRQRVASFMSSYSGIPAISIGLKVSPDIPVVDFDAFSGLYELVVHLVRVHHKKRIAMIRGPENHASGQDRYHAYLKALEDCGLEVDPDLVSSPHPWGEGRAALQELIDERGLVPSLDFDALVCASDLMMFSAVRHLEKLGVSIPSSVAVGGFNDSETNKLLFVSPTTVRMPIDSMVDTAMERIMAILDGKAAGGDAMLPCQLVIRRSCGCLDSFGGQKEAARTIHDVPSFIEWATAYCAHLISADDLEYVATYAMRLKSPTKAEGETFLSRFASLCRIFFQKGGEADDLLEIFHWFSTLLPLSDETREFCQKNLDRVILDVYSHVNGQNGYRRLETTGALNAFKMELLSTRSLDTLAGTVCSRLPALGFSQAYIVLNDGENGRLLAGGYNSVSSSLEKENFRSPLLLPQRYSSLTDRGAFVVEPLISDSEWVGYLVLEVRPGIDASVIEDVMASTSSALKGIRLTEDARLAQERAENAERSLKEFYANVSEELREPLMSIRHVLETVSDSDSRRRVVDSVMKADHLLDLVMIEKGEVEVTRCLTDTASLIREFTGRHSFASMSVDDDLPAVFTDRKNFLEVLDILYYLASSSAEGQGVDFIASAKPNGLAASFSVSLWHPSLIRNNPSLQLAERTVVLLGGSFHFKEHSVMIQIPWPSLCGEEARRGFGTCLFVTADASKPIPGSLRCFPRLETVEECQLASSFVVPESVTQLAYDASVRGECSSVVLNLLRNHQQTRSLPFLCFNATSFGADLWTSLCAHQGGSGKEGDGDILCVGSSLPAGLGRLDAFSRRVFFSSVDDLLSSMHDRPSMIILSECDPAQIQAIRMNHLSSSTPVLVVKDHFAPGDIETVMSIPGLLVANSSICESDEFINRLLGIFAGNPILPPLTGIMVKKAIIYLNRKARSQISRWQIADSVNISEDYLTRIFKKEMGISPWDYLNRYRIQLAREMLRTTGKTINEVAGEIGFQDQAYFCRVFKKIVGVAPGKIRK